LSPVILPSFTLSTIRFHFEKRKKGLAPPCFLAPLDFSHVLFSSVGFTSFLMPSLMESCHIQIDRLGHAFCFESLLLIPADMLRLAKGEVFLDTPSPIVIFSKPNLMS